eukprot:CAMPEP_0185907626 /NCGR_PEP_ID=MMETSP0196C-20130402/7422_1 /TAXON_ID=2932 /ORGANISM="Alexandrium fundyense, Strain CCMP1719" /LENGTH=42 /DNA_ID= /DNA_START= /DNA_END= /DNA_ORIENTATION=
MRLPSARMWAGTSKKAVPGRECDVMYHRSRWNLASCFFVVFD